MVSCRWNISDSELKNCRISKSDATTVINKRFPNKAVVEYLEFTRFYPFSKRCDLATDIYCCKNDESGIPRPVRVQSYPSPWMRFDVPSSELPNVIWETDDVPCTPDIPNLKFDTKSTSASRWNSFQLKLHKLFHR
jgi:hypothetical protein